MKNEDGFIEDVNEYSTLNLKRNSNLYGEKQEDYNTTFYCFSPKKPEYMIKEVIEESELSKAIDKFMFNMPKNPREEKRYYPKKGEIWLLCRRHFNKYELEYLVGIAKSFNYIFSKEDIEDFRQIEKRR